MNADGSSQQQRPPTIITLGAITARFPDGPDIALSRASRQLVAILVAVGPAGASADRLAEELWADDLPSRWRPSLRMAFSRLRKSFGIDCIARSGGHYRLDLPVDAVDYWRLLDLLELDVSPDESELRRLLAGVPFPDVDRQELVRQAAESAQAAQSELAQRFCGKAETMHEITAVALVAHQRAVDSLNERLAVAIGSCLLRTGFIATAVAYLDAALATFRSELSTAPSDLLALRAGVLDASDPEGGEQPRPAGRTYAGVPSRLEHLLSDRCIGRDEELRLLSSGRNAILQGPSGAGKTRLLAEVAARAVSAGERVCYLGADRSAMPYGPFVSSFPELRRLLVPPEREAAPGGDRAGRQRAVQAARSVAVLEHLDGQAHGARYWILIDDAHSLDAGSRQLVGFLARSAFVGSVVLIVSGRNDVEGEDWVSTLAELRRSGFEEVGIASLDASSLEELLDDCLEGLPVGARSALATELIARNGDLPAVARSLIGAIDQETMTFDEGIETYDPKRWVQPALGLDKEVVDVAVAAAVLGISFSVSEVIELVDRNEEEVTDAFEELWELGRVADAGEPDRLQFRDALVRDAFLRSAPRFRVERLHRRAAERATDLHAIAHHQAAAVPIVSAEAAARSLVASARRYLEQGSWRDAVTQLRSADRVTEGNLDVETLILLAQALDLSGVSGAGPRQRAFEAARSAGRWSDALAAALSGLPEAERPDGDPARIAFLTAIPSGEIAPTERFEQGAALARQHALNGQPAEADTWARRTASLASTPAQQAKAAIVRWSVAHHLSAGGHRFSDEVVAGAERGDRMRIVQMMSISAVEAGDFDRGAALSRDFLALAIELGDPVRIWQGRVFDAMVAFGQGRREASATHIDEAADYGRRHGMRLATLVWAGQLFHQKWLDGDLQELLSGYESMQADIGRSSLAEASLALVLDASDRSDEAWRRAEPLLADALRRPRSPAIVVLAMLAGLVGHFGSANLRAEVRERLEPFADTFLVAGYGIGCTGPVGRLLAPLAPDEDVRRRWLSRAADLADRSGSPIWRAITRADLDDLAS